MGGTCCKKRRPKREPKTVVATRSERAREGQRSGTEGTTEQPPKKGKPARPTRKRRKQLAPSPPTQATQVSDIFLADLLSPSSNVPRYTIPKASPYFVNPGAKYALPKGTARRGVTASSRRPASRLTGYSLSPSSKGASSTRIVDTGYFVNPKCESVRVIDTVSDSGSSDSPTSTYRVPAGPDAGSGYFVATKTRYALPNTRKAAAKTPGLRKAADKTPRLPGPR